MVFNIGSQQGAINNVAGNQTIHGGQHVSFTDSETLGYARELAQALRGLGLDESAHDADDIVRELKRHKPDREHIAARSMRIAQTITAVAAAESAVHRPLAALAGWLGTLGTPVLHALGL